MSAMTCGVGYKTEKSIETIESWLDANCEGDWDVVLKDMDDSNPAKMLKVLDVLFELSADKERFKIEFS